ncbi:2-amino-4-hydroxy-6-hydroxymethyldihydropteridine diphosphokinase [Orbaceae bacterium ac157xtp]
MTTAYIALGANLGDPLTQANLALKAIKQIPNTQCVAVSPLYRSKPLGPQDQPDYLNAVIELDTQLAPLDLLHALQQIESQLGRERKDIRWGARTIDLDILLFGDLVVQSAELTVPHYDMKNREFVIYPLYDLAPNLIFPDGEKIANIIKRLDKNEMKLWAIR